MVYSNKILYYSEITPLSFSIGLLVLIVVISLFVGYQNSIHSRIKSRWIIILLSLIIVPVVLYFYFNGELNIESFESMTLEWMKTSILAKLVVTVGILALTYVSTIALDKLTKRMLKEDGRQVVDEHRREVVFRIVQVILYVLVIFTILDYWNLDIRGILLGAGALAAIVGLSAKQTLSSALAGLVLLFSRPFKVGDWIQIEDTEGTVRRITIVNTILTTPRDEEVVIPNDTISDKKIRNKTKTNKLRLSAKVMSSYECDVQKSLTIAERKVSECDIVSDVPEPRSQVEEFADSGIQMRILFWIEKPTPRRRNVCRSIVMKKVRESFDNSDDVRIPYQTTKIKFSGDEESDSPTSENLRDYNGEDV